MSTSGDDETRWYPIGQTVETPSRAARRAVKDNGDDDGDGATFAFADEDMGKLNRYLHGGRVLPLDKDSFCQNIYNDCVGFLGDSSQSPRQWTKADGDDSAFDALCTFDKMNTLSSQIYGYADNAGADDSSYYLFMFDQCSKYNDDGATDQQREAASKAILDATEDLLSDIAPMQLHAKKVTDALNVFELACDKREGALVDSETNMTSILNEDLGDIDDLQAKIDSQLIDIAADQKIIDSGQSRDQTLGLNSLLGC
ncbi:hypothetical protein HC256_008143 [Beauveria bassiana]|nr:hypothetical protein HC256_008143 [Beauveria bassiana]